MRFEIGTIWASREKVDRDVVCAVAGDRKIERFREPRDLHKGRDAAAIGDVGLGIGHRASRYIVLELPERAQVFAGRNRHAAGSHDAGMTGNVIGNDRLFEPGEVVGLQCACGANGFLDRPFHVGIRHQGKAATEMLAHRLHARGVGCEIGAAHFHLDGAKALGKIIVGLLQKRLDGEIEVDAAGVTGHAGVETTEQTKQRQIRAARLQVPQGDIER